MTLPVIVFWILFLASMFSKIEYLFYLFFISLPFADLNIIPGGGFNVLASSACAAALIARVLFAMSAHRYAAMDVISCILDVRRLGLIFLFLLSSLLVTFLSINLFHGLITVINQATNKDVLYFTGGNINQSVNLCISFGTVLVFYYFSIDVNFRSHIPMALLINGIVLSATGLVNFVAEYTGSSALLDGFHTTAYLHLLEGEVAGVHRLVGLMTEASAFGPACVTASTTLLFLQYVLTGTARRAALLTSMLLILLAVLSTSSTAYVGLAFYIGSIAAYFAYKIIFSDGLLNVDVVKYIVAFVVIITASSMLLLAIPEIYAGVYAMLDAALFTKTTSDSYIERMMWNEVALNAFFASSGLGVGLGSTRASNLLLAVLSSTGLIGTLFLFCFIARLFIAKPDNNAFNGKMVVGLRLTVLVGFMQGSLAAPNADFGVGLGAVLGLLAGYMEKKSRQTVWIR